MSDDKRKLNRERGQGRLCECELDPLGIVLVGKNGAEKKSMGLSINKMRR